MLLYHSNPLPLPSFATLSWGICRRCRKGRFPTEQLPAAAKTFVQKNFLGQTISYAKIDRECMKTKYEVRLSNGTEIDFDRAGNWDKVDCKFGAVPSKLVPSNISHQVKKQYHGVAIPKIDKEYFGYEIGLSNRLDHKFNKQGKLAYIDD